MQKFCPNCETIAINHQCWMKNEIASKFSGLISASGKSKNYTGKSKFLRNYQVTHQKGGKISIHF